MKSILLVDDHKIVRVAVKMIIKEMLPDAFIAEADDADAALAAVKKRDYDVIVLDMNLGRENFSQLLSSIRQICFTARILIFTQNNPSIYARHMLKLGANGYLHKNAEDTEIKAALTAILEGKSYLPADADNSDTPFSMLSQKEFDIMILIAKGAWLTEIADLLKIQVSTVATHQRNIFWKLNVKSKADLTKLALYYDLWI
ncbi:MAG: response regulator transcription factor [Agriterribacter sp.]